MPHYSFIAGVVARIVPDPGLGPQGLPRGPLLRSPEPKIMVCLDLLIDDVDPSGPRSTVGGVETVAYRTPPPHHVIFRGEWAETISLSGLEVGDVMGASFSIIPWDPVTLAEAVRSCGPSAIPVLGEGARPVIFLKGSDGAVPGERPRYPAVTGRRPAPDLHGGSVTARQAPATDGGTGPLSAAPCEGGAGLQAAAPGEGGAGLQAAAPGEGGAGPLAAVPDEGGVRAPVSAPAGFNPMPFFTEADLADRLMALSEEDLAARVAALMEGDAAGWGERFPDPCESVPVSCCDRSPRQKSCLSVMEGGRSLLTGECLEPRPWAGPGGTGGGPGKDGRAPEFAASGTGGTCGIWGAAGISGTVGHDGTGDIWGAGGISGTVGYDGTGGRSGIGDTVGNGGTGGRFGIGGTVDNGGTGGRFGIGETVSNCGTGGRFGIGGTAGNDGTGGTGDASGRADGGNDSE
ncbi:MAG: hypothetical protein LBT40_00495 [Deltaproteobacteria bacterium]|nr:hypothetical protein [Deltaproteobacteria bacterium]